MKCPVRPLDSALLRAAVFGILMLTGIGIALGQARNGPEDPDRYRVEVVLFTQPPIDPGRPEQPGRQAGALGETMAWPLRRVDEGTLGYRQLPVADHSLARAARRISAREGFEVLWHAAWEQPGLGPARAQAVALPMQLGADGISGFVRVSCPGTGRGAADATRGGRDQRLCPRLSSALSACRGRTALRRGRKSPLGHEHQPADAQRPAALPGSSGARTAGSRRPGQRRYELISVLVVGMGCVDGIDVAQIALVIHPRAEYVTFRDGQAHKVR